MFETLQQFTLKDKLCKSQHIKKVRVAAAEVELWVLPSKDQAHCTTTGQEQNDFISKITISCLFLFSIIQWQIQSKILEWGNNVTRSPMRKIFGGGGQMPIINQIDQFILNKRIKKKKKQGKRALEKTKGRGAGPPPQIHQ